MGATHGPDRGSIGYPEAPSTAGTEPEALLRKKRLASLYAQSQAGGRSTFFRNQSTAFPTAPRPKSNAGGGSGAGNLLASSTGNKRMLGE